VICEIPNSESILSTTDNQKSLLSEALLNEQLINPKFRRTSLKVLYEKRKTV
jgi:hypothetical protein